MTAVGNKLSSQQLTFLNANFVVFDPFAGECHTNFTQLETCHVILIGEMHHCRLLQDIQSQFLQLFATNPSTCLLGENFPPGESVNVRDIPCWHHVPAHLKMYGADVRSSFTAAQYLEWITLQEKINGVVAKIRGRADSTYLQIAEILNRVEVIDRDQQCLDLSDELFESVEKLESQFFDFLTITQQEYSQIGQTIDELIKDKFANDATVVRSNQGLAREIFKSSKTFKRVVAIWGKAHFVCDREFSEGLRKAGISSVILVPNPALDKRELEESFWAQQKMPMLNLKIGVEEFLSIPSFFSHYLKPSIQNILTSTKKTPTVLNSMELIELIGDSESVVFPSDHPIYLNDVPLQDYHALEELLVRDVRQIHTQLILTLSHLLMRARLRVVGIECEGGIQILLHCFDNKPVLELSFDQPVTVILKKTNDRMGYARDLFKDVQRLPEKSFTLLPEERLFFCDVTAAEIELIQRSPHGLTEWIQSKAPPETEIVIDGLLSSGPAEITIANQIVTALCIGTKKGCVFTLQ